MTDQPLTIYRLFSCPSSYRITRAPSEVRTWTDEGRINCRLGVDLLLAAIGSPQRPTWTGQGIRSLIELLLITFRCLWRFLGLEHFRASQELAPAREGIAGNRRVSPRTFAPRDDVWLSVSHVLGRFGAPPGRYQDDYPFSVIASERFEQRRNDFADPLPVPRQNEST